MVKKKFNWGVGILYFIFLTWGTLGWLYNLFKPAIEQNKIGLAIFWFMIWSSATYHIISIHTEIQDTIQKKEVGK